MGILGKLFGGGRKDQRRRPEVPTAGEAASQVPDTAGMSTKELIRLLGSPKRAARLEAAARLAETRERAAMRPLMNAYLNYGEPEVLEALSAFGGTLTQAAIREAGDPGLIGERRARVMDILGVTGEEAAAIAVRENLDPVRTEPVVRTRACVALARLGDTRGIDLLARDLELTDADQRTAALAALRELDIPQAREAVEAHVRRYLGQTGAIPPQIEISAPRLENPQTSIREFVCDRIRSAPHTLTVVVGSGAIKMARVQQVDLQRALPDHQFHFATRRLVPEEQIALVHQARDAATADPSGRYVLVGRIPDPKGSPSLPHFLTRPQGEPYTAKVLFVDPHECNVVMDWWHYVDERAEVPTDFEVVLAISRPENSAISAEEYMIWELTSPDRKRDYLRAFLAHL